MIQPGLFREAGRSMQSAASPNGGGRFFSAPPAARFSDSALIEKTQGEAGNK